MQISLVDMEQGERGRVVGIQGGKGVTDRLHNMGIFKDQPITKVHSQLFHGPVLVEVGSAQVAIGFGMAQKIMVEVKR
jgi:Fe2+ transport system protein FeoA